MALMFFHIPRTGGSSVWHSLAGVAARQNRIIADLYHQSKEITGHPFAPDKAIRFFHEFLEQTGLCFDDDVIYHHHTHQYEPYLLESDQVQRVTLIRDPVSRLVSEAFHMRRFLREEHASVTAGQPPSGEYEFHRKEYGEAWFNRMIEDEVDPDALVLNYAQLNQNYYLSYFSTFLHPQHERKTFDEAAALDLAQLVRQTFIWVGHFPALGEFMNTCGLIADLDVNIEKDMQHIANGSKVPALKPQTLAQIKAINSLDYVFTDAVLQAYDQRLISRLIKLKEKRLSYSENTLRHVNEEQAQQTAKLGQLNDELARQSALLGQLNDELSKQSALAEHLNDELVKQAALARNAEQARLEATAAATSTAEELAHCKGLLQALYSSTSWRVTAPLRNAASWIKR